MTKINIEPRKLYEGCIQAAITHAVAVGMYPELNYEHSWDGMNYCMNDSQGCRATITFHYKYIIAVFQDIQKVDWDVDAMAYFKEAEDDIVKIAKEEALQYVLENVEGTVRPVITAAFWGTWEQLNSMQSFDEIFENGGYILEKQLCPYNKAAELWKEDYDLDEKQTDLVRVLYDKKINSGGEKIRLLDDEIQSLYGEIEECFVSLEELDFVRADE